jgi:hypothetical protein
MHICLGTPVIVTELQNCTLALHPNTMTDSWALWNAEQLLPNLYFMGFLT